MVAAGSAEVAGLVAEGQGWEERCLLELPVESLVQSCQDLSGQDLSALCSLYRALCSLNQGPPATTASAAL